jgi:hypothetical protein
MKPLGPTARREIRTPPDWSRQTHKAKVSCVFRAFRPALLATSTQPFQDWPARATARAKRPSDHPATGSTLRRLAMLPIPDPSFTTIVPGPSSSRRYRISPRDRSPP